MTVNTFIRAHRTRERWAPACFIGLWDGPGRVFDHRCLTGTPWNPERLVRVILSIYTHFFMDIDEKPICLRKSALKGKKYPRTIVIAADFFSSTWKVVLFSWTISLWSVSGWHIYMCTMPFHLQSTFFFFVLPFALFFGLSVVPGQDSCRPCGLLSKSCSIKCSNASQRGRQQSVHESQRKGLIKTTDDREQSLFLFFHSWTKKKKRNYGHQGEEHFHQRLFKSCPCSLAHKLNNNSSPGQ